MGICVSGIYFSSTSMIFQLGFGYVGVLLFCASSYAYSSTAGLWSIWSVVYISPWSIWSISLVIYYSVQGHYSSGLLCIIYFFTKNKVEFNPDSILQHPKSCSHIILWLKNMELCYDYAFGISKLFVLSCNQMFRLTAGNALLPSGWSYLIILTLWFLAV